MEKMHDVAGNYELLLDVQKKKLRGLKDSGMQ